MHRKYKDDQEDIEDNSEEDFSEEEEDLNINQEDITYLEASPFRLRGKTIFHEVVSDIKINIRTSDAKWNVWIIFFILFQHKFTS